ncbi:RagB/SusD family nutrient uptake outer membrane protein [Rufibacter sp. LB8]|uniref:RagB/SusD family nutrient uptake outer membrane protein n=1 Tax=Rufibacter sp. LB8 TaxID=2777781 RepID=UPI00178C6185|nr:RagB/SusD family nutrient uptake outer membrane protein [Rufibacter sp. LB8]
MNTLLLLCLSLLGGCQDFLEEKPDRQLVVPSTLRDLQALLDNHNLITAGFPNAPEISADNYYLTDTDWAALSREENRRMYIWAKDGVFAPGTNDWSYLYRPVYYANTVLEHVAGMPRTAANAAQWDDVKGQALFLRASYFQQGAMLWAPAYDVATAGTDLAISLRLTTDFNVPSERATVQQTYGQILQDLREAVRLLPIATVHAVRPNRAAAYGLLARTYLSMRDYPTATLYADSSLQLHSKLMNYNTLSAAATYPIPQFNQEIMAEFSLSGAQNTLDIARAKVVPELYTSYHANDLRKTLFFRANPGGTYGFRGSADQMVGGMFAGVATDEVYLTRAEGYARQGKADEALQDLNTLLVTRWKTGTFVPFNAATAQDALTRILQERRKQLLMRGLRWMDLKRLNKEGAGITLTRTVQGVTHTLAPNDARYARPLPEDLVELSGMPQNPQ